MCSPEVQCRTATLRGSSFHCNWKVVFKMLAAKIPLEVFTPVRVLYLHILIDVWQLPKLRNELVDG